MFSKFTATLRTVTAAAAVVMGCTVVGAGSVQAAPLFEIDGAPFSGIGVNRVVGAQANSPISGAPGNAWQEGILRAPIGSTISLLRLGWEGTAEVRVFCGANGAANRCDVKPQSFAEFPDEDADKLSRFPLPGAATSNPAAATWTHTTSNQNDAIFLRLASYIDGTRETSLNNRNENSVIPPGAPLSFIFAYIDDSGAYSATATNRVAFGFDDGLNGGDDNHDDYMGVLTVTPIPGAVWLFGTAALGLAAVHRRRRAAAAAA